MDLFGRVKGALWLPLDVVWSIMVKLETGEEGSAVRLDAAHPDVSINPSVADREQMLGIFCLMFRIQAGGR